MSKKNRIRKKIILAFLIVILALIVLGIIKNAYASGGGAQDTADMVNQIEKAGEKTEFAEAIVLYAVTGIAGLLGGGALSSIAYGIFHAAKGAEGIVTGLASTAVFMGLRHKAAPAAKTATKAAEGATEAATTETTVNPYAPPVLPHNPLLLEDHSSYKTSGIGAVSVGPDGKTRIYKGQSAIAANAEFDFLKLNPFVMRNPRHFSSAINKVKQGGTVVIEDNTGVHRYTRSGDYFVTGDDIIMDKTNFLSKHNKIYS